MNKPTEKQMNASVKLLAKLNLTWEETRKIIAFIKSQEAMLDIVDRMKEKDFKLTPKETMNICYRDKCHT